MAFFSTLASGWQQSAALQSTPSKTVSFDSVDGSKPELKRSTEETPSSPPTPPPLPAPLRTGKANLRTLADSTPTKSESEKATKVEKAKLKLSFPEGERKERQENEGREEYDDPPELDAESKERKKKKKGSFREKRELKKGSSARNLGDSNKLEEINDPSSDIGKKKSFKGLFEVQYSSSH